MILDKFDKDKDMLIFKNAYDESENGQPKKFEIQRTDPTAPEELYFVHIEIRDMKNLPSQKRRKANKQTEKKSRSQSNQQHICCNLQ